MTHRLAIALIAAPLCALSFASPATPNVADSLVVPVVDTAQPGIRANVDRGTPPRPRAGQGDSQGAIGPMYRGGDKGVIAPMYRGGKGDTTGDTPQAARRSDKGSRGIVSPRDDGSKPAARKGADGPRAIVSPRDGGSRAIVSPRDDGAKGIVSPRKPSSKP